MVMKQKINKYCNKYITWFEGLPLYLCSNLLLWEPPSCALLKGAVIKHSSAGCSPHCLAGLYSDLIMSDLTWQHPVCALSSTQKMQPNSLHFLDLFFFKFAGLRTLSRTNVGSLKYTVGLLKTCCQSAKRLLLLTSILNTTWREKNNNNNNFP